MTSQSIAASVAGTGLGIIVSKLTGTSAAWLMAAYVPLSVISIAANYHSSKFVVLKTFNLQRAEVVAQHYLKSNKIVLEPEQVAHHEGIVTSTHIFHIPLYVGPNLATMKAPARQNVLENMVDFGAYVLAVGRCHIGRQRGPCVYLFFKRSADHVQRLAGVIHACGVREEMAQQGSKGGSGNEARMRVSDVAAPDPARLKEECEAAGWDLQTSFFRGYDVETTDPASPLQ